MYAAEEVELITSQSDVLKMQENLSTASEPKKTIFKDITP